ncbi:MAG: CDP-diacylglycerol--glycerol-3-phosphate 3-phosphatidyltransferase, partial [Actinobacteria bacterium]|nr:CDP-diacylglycerol--glycerol-3-phosphate 3-phosphatidyltransferase [Actinomycetota bacterium]
MADREVGSGTADDDIGDLDAPLLPGLGEHETIELGELRAEARADPHWLNVPNAVTFLRALLVPVILWLLTIDSRSAQWWAFGIFVFAAATDSIDGWVARRWYGVTRWGQLADPIADKLLIIGALASLAAVGMLPWWAVLVIAGREAAVTLLRIRLVRGRDLVMAASGWGKAKTVSQVVAVGAFLWPGVPHGLRVPLLYLAIALTLWSGIEYAFRAGRLARAA